jgi:hypothetical protein
VSAALVRCVRPSRCARRSRQNRAPQNNSAPENNPATPPAASGPRDGRGRSGRIPPSKMTFCTDVACGALSLFAQSLSGLRNCGGFAGVFCGYVIVDEGLEGDR